MTTSSLLASLPSAVPRASLSSAVSMAMTRRGALSPGRGVPRQPPSAHNPRAMADPASPKPSSAITRTDSDMRMLSGDGSGSGRRCFAVLGVARPCSLRVARARDPELGPHDGELGRGMALGDAGIELLAGLDDAHTGEAAEPALAGALDGRRPPRHHPRVGGRHEQGAALAQRREHVGAQESGKLAGGVGMALVKRRAVD